MAKETFEGAGSIGAASSLEEVGAPRYAVDTKFDAVGIELPVMKISVGNEVGITAFILGQASAAEIQTIEGKK